MQRSGVGAEWTERTCEAYPSLWLTQQLTLKQVERWKEPGYAILIEDDLLLSPDFLRLFWSVQLC